MFSCSRNSISANLGGEYRLIYAETFAPLVNFPILTAQVKNKVGQLIVTFKENTKLLQTFRKFFFFLRGGRKRGSQHTSFQIKCNYENENEIITFEAS